MGKNKSLTQPYPLILASTSKYRASLLNQLGWIFSTSAPEVNEDQFKSAIFSPEEIAQKLSQLKAKAVYLKNEGSCVIGSDQICYFQGEILGKPLSVTKAVDQLEKIQGKSHHLITAVTIICPKKEITFFNETTLYMRPLSRDQIETYVHEDLPLDCAGSYKLESKGIKLFEKIEMTDHTSIIGLPLIQLTNSLLELGFTL
jgi:septum formation protein